MEITISDKELERLASDPSFRGKFPEEVVDMFRQTLQIVAAVPNESDLAHFSCLDYRKVGGDKTRRRLTLTEDAHLLVRVPNGEPKIVVEQIRRSRKNKK